MKYRNKHVYLLLLVVTSLLLLVTQVNAADTADTKEIMKESTDNLNIQNTLNDTKIIDKKTENTIKKDTNNNTIYVNSKGLATNDGLTKESPTTLENAIQNIADNTTIYLTTNDTSDTYTLKAPITISKSYWSSVSQFNIRAEEGKNITISGNNKTNLLTITGYTINISNINFKNSNSKNYSAIEIKNSNININNCTFTDNTNLKYGSSLTGDSSNITIKNTNFYNNTASYAGAIYALKSNITIQSSKFTDNKASYYGGAILQIDSTKLSVTSSNFTNNTASSGGAIYVMQADVMLNKNTFESNNAYIAGSIYTYNNTVTIKNNNILRNSLNESLVYVLNPKSYNIDENWWGLNNPNFNSITNGIIPNSWILMTFTSTGSKQNNSQNITVTLNTLSNSSNITANIPKRQVFFEASNATFKTKTANIVNTLNNTYTGNDTVYAIIDDEKMQLNTKIIPSLSVKNYTASINDTINITIASNKDITGKVFVTINNITKQLTANAQMIVQYKIDSSYTQNMYPINISYFGNAKYKQTNVISYLFVQNKNADTTNRIIATLNSSTKNLTLPSYYSLLDEGYMTPVKEQGSSGSCVVFAAIGAVESSIKKVTNVTYDLSENNMKNMFKKYSSIGFSQLTPNDGGYDMEPVGYMASGYGPILEKMDEYSTKSHVSNIFNTSFQIQNIYFIPARTSSLDNDKIKDAIIKYGPVYTGVQSSGLLNQYNVNVNKSNHAVIIIGWNDTYSRNNFQNTPPGDGAFIIKNSWGKNTGNDGYQYVSYYDSVIGNIPYVGDYNSVNFVVDYKNNYNYTGIYQYDDVCYVYKIEDNGGKYWINNTYTATANETIAAIGTYFVDNSDYIISVYVNNKLVTTKKGTIDIPGYRTIQLDSLCRVSEHDKICVVIQFNQNISKSYLYVPLQDTDYPLYMDSGRSFISFDGKKYDDLYDYDESGHMSAPIKVYTLNVPKITTSLKTVNDSLNITTNVNNINGTGRLYYKINGDLIKDSNNKVVSKSVNSNTTVGYNYNITTLSSGNYTLETVLVHNGLNISQSKTFNVNHNVTIKAANITTKINDTVELTVNVTINQIKQSKGTVYLKYSNQTVIATSKVSLGQAKLTFKMPIAGNYTPIVEYVSDNISAHTIIKLIVNKLGTKLTINTTNTYVYNNSQITGTLTDTNNKSISNARIYLQVNDVEYKVTTNSTGGYRLTYKNIIVSTNNVTARYDGSNYYNPTTKKSTYKSLIMPTATTITTVKGTIGDNITLTSKIVDKNNNPVINGYVIFKINGITIKDNGQLNGSTNALKVYVQNGIAICNITAYLNIRHGKNLTSVYAGSTTYEQSRSNTATAEIRLRDSQIVVKTNVTKTKQDAYIKITAIVYDTTTKKRLTNIVSDNQQYVYFKVNGITLKNKNGSVIQVKIVNGQATYNYKVPIGLSCVTDGKTLTPKNHTITAGFYNPNYYPGTTNTTNFQVERSPVTINITNVLVNNKTHKMAITAAMKDYHNNYLLGTNKMIIKINGVTLKDSKQKTMYFSITNGRVKLSNIAIPAYNKYTSIMLVTQDRLAYVNARNTTTKITVTN